MADEKKVNLISHPDAITAYYPYVDDPRFLSLQNQFNHCVMRFQIFCRCARELGEDDPRCKYQFFRAQTNCHEYILEDWMEHRQRGTCLEDRMPDRRDQHCRQ
eukprot:GEMP01019034.1.p3 GENE.GEMP01019034.1~~GEMP01019034.1.p3  ORF type:complete len:103 (+),score=19.92 GEMP01019034.1:179-487(+)